MLKGKIREPARVDAGTGHFHDVARDLREVPTEVHCTFKDDEVKGQWIQASVNGMSAPYASVSMTIKTQHIINTYLEINIQ